MGFNSGFKGLKTTAVLLNIQGFLDVRLKETRREISIFTSAMN